MSKLTVFEKHQLKVAKATLKMNDVFAAVMGGMTKEQARKVIERLSKKEER